MIYISQTSLHTSIPDALQFGVNPSRFEASKVSVAGNVIRQTSILHASTATATWSGILDAETASTLKTMHETSAQVTIHYRNTGYTATMKYSEAPATGDQVAVSLQFGIIAEIQ